MKALPRSMRPRASTLLTISLFIALSFCFPAWTPSLGSMGQGVSANYDESKAGTFTLPDPLVFNDGKPVKTAHEWRQRRRAEILQLLETNVYGRTPKPPKQIRFQVSDVDRSALGGKAIRKQVTIYFPTPKSEAHEDLLIYIPTKAPKSVPMILDINFSGNQSVTNDPGVKAANLWLGKPPAQQQAPERLRGTDKEFDIAKLLDRGYGFATLCYQDIEPDFKDGYKMGGLRQQFFPPGQTEPAPDGWGAIGAWAYGLSRAMDYLEKDKDVDAHRVAVMGHSRLGKTVLWAGAQDQRFAMVLSSCSGRGGASPWRRNYGETLESMSGAFPFWFCPNLWKYVGQVDKLPVDSDELIALIAPRPVYITSAEEDQWADPRGMFMAAVAAGPVYQLLHAEGLGTDQMPALNQPIMHTIAFHIRAGKHAVTAFDWDQFLAFADLHLRAH
ncbi:MAG: acetylxylan esterase [Terriglobia bacterium]